MSLRTLSMSTRPRVPLTPSTTDVGTFTERGQLRSGEHLDENIVVGDVAFESRAQGALQGPFKHCLNERRSPEARTHDFAISTRAEAKQWFLGGRRSPGARTDFAISTRAGAHSFKQCLNGSRETLVISRGAGRYRPSSSPDRPMMPMCWPGWISTETQLLAAGAAPGNEVIARVDAGLATIWTARGHA